MAPHMFDFHRLFALSVTTAVFCLMHSASATQYTVGGSAGWSLGNDLLLWASQYTFNVGDDLYFPYQAGQHSVLLVTEDDYNNCNTANPITTDNGQGNMVMTLVTPETYYFICGAQGHCSEGLKLAVLVEGSPTSTAPAPPVLTPPASPSIAPPDAPPVYSPPDAPTHDTPPHAPVSSTPYYSPYTTFHYASAPALCSTMSVIVGAAVAYTLLVL